MLPERPARGLRRLLESLPWPLAVIPPFVATLGLPILLLAITFSVVASKTHVVQSSMRLSGRVEVHGMKAVAADRVEVDFGELAPLGRSDASFHVINENSEPAWIVVTATGVPPGCSLVDLPEDAVRLDPGETEEFHVGVLREAEAEGGDYQFKLVLLASREQ